MTDLNNGFGERSESFNELLKKYQTLEDNDGTRETAVSDSAPAQKETDGFAEGDGGFEVHMDEDFFGDMEADDAFEPAPQPEPEPQSVAEEPQPVAEEPQLKYDLNMFGGGVDKNKGFSDFDDSWLDDSLDESIFYRPSPIETSAQNRASASEDFFDGQAEADFGSEQPEAVYEPVQEAVQEPIREPVQEQASQPEQPKPPAPPEMIAVAGGYIAPSAVDRFTFDEESDLDFEAQSDFTQELGNENPTPSSEPKPKKRKPKESGMNENTSMTGFEKNYKRGSAEGKKKGNFFTRNLIPLRGDSGAEIVRKIIMLIAVLAILGSGGYLFNDYVIVPYTTQKDIGELNNMIGESNDVINLQLVENKYPNVKFPQGMLEKYTDLYARNPDLAGWITINGLDISLPVVRAENNEKYLKTDFDGKHNKYGSLFMNCSNKLERLDMNTTIFGHYMKDTKMFGNLVQYKSVKGYKKAPLIEFNTIYGDYKWKIFAVFITNGTSQGDKGYLFNYIFTNLKSEADLEEFLGEIKQRSLYYPKVDIALSDKILTLSTCTYEFEEARLVIMARMVRRGESTAVDTSNIRFNPNPRYPQGYYDEKSLGNPYASAPKWYPS